MHDCEAVDINTYFDHAPISITTRVRVKAPADAAFRALEDEASWPRWAPAITKVTWTSPRPFAISMRKIIRKPVAPRWCGAVTSARKNPEPAP